VRLRTPARGVLAALGVLRSPCHRSRARGAAGQAARTPPSPTALRALRLSQTWQEQNTSCRTGSAVRHVDSSTAWVSRSPQAEARAASSPLAPRPEQASTRPASPSQKGGTAARADGPAAAGQAPGRPVRPSSLPATSPRGTVRPSHRPLAAEGPCRERRRRRRDPAPGLRRHRDEGGEGGHHFCKSLWRQRAPTTRLRTTTADALDPAHSGSGEQDLMLFSAKQF